MSLGLYVFGPEGDSMKVNSESTSTLKQGLVAGLGAVAMAAVISVAGPQEAKAVNDGVRRRQRNN